MSRPHTNDSQANNFSVGEPKEDVVIRNSRLTAAEGELTPEQVMRKFGIPEFSTKLTEVVKHFVEAEARPN